MSRKLVKLGLLSEIDRAAMALYCRAWEVWNDAIEQVRKSGTVVKSPSGYPMISPYLSVERNAFNQMRAILVEFGMSPSSRSRIDTKAAILEDEDDGLLG